MKGRFTTDELVLERLSCVAPVGGDQPPPALYFCDGCQESVPINDVVTKKITIEGRLLCRRCGSRTSAGP